MNNGLALLALVGLVWLASVPPASAQAEKPKLGLVLRFAEQTGVETALKIKQSLERKLKTEFDALNMIVLFLNSRPGDTLEAAARREGVKYLLNGTFDPPLGGELALAWEILVASDQPRAEWTRHPQSDILLKETAGHSDTQASAQSMRQKFLAVLGPARSEKTVFVWCFGVVPGVDDKQRIVLAALQSVFPWLLPAELSQLGPQKQWRHKGVGMDALDVERVCVKTQPSVEHQQARDRADYYIEGQIGMNGPAEVKVRLTVRPVGHQPILIKELRKPASESDELMIKGLASHIIDNWPKTVESR